MVSGKTMIDRANDNEEFKNIREKENWGKVYVKMHFFMG